MVDKSKKSWTDGWTFLIVVCVLLPLALRSFLYAPFNIPSGSMKPTLLVGDYVFVSKFAYGYSKFSFPFSPAIFEGRIMTEGRTPTRGDVVVFRLPTDDSIDYVKRLIGMPGDRIRVENGEVILNGKKLSRKKIAPFIDEDADGNTTSIIAYTETLPNGVSYTTLDQLPDGPLDNTPEYIVPADHYFMMGDNRDNSQDSRVLNAVGYVPAQNLVGHAELIFFSLKQPFWQIWNWFAGFRSERLLQWVQQPEAA
jgi:signal peptidase I